MNLFIKHIFFFVCFGIEGERNLITHTYDDVSNPFTIYIQSWMVWFRIQQFIKLEEISKILVKWKEIVRG